MTNKLRSLEIELENVKNDKIKAMLSGDNLKVYLCVLKGIQIVDNIEKERERLNAD